MTKDRDSIVGTYVRRQVQIGRWAGLVVTVIGLIGVAVSGFQTFAILNAQGINRVVERWDGPPLGVVFFLVLALGGLGASINCANILRAAKR